MDKEKKMETPLWEATKACVIDLYSLTNDGYFDSEPILRSQIRSHALVMMTYVAAGVNSRKSGSKTYNLNRAELSALKLHSLVVVAEALGAVDTKLLTKLLESLDDVKLQATKLAIYIYNNPRGKEQIKEKENQDKNEAKGDKG